MEVKTKAKLNRGETVIELVVVATYIPESRPVYSRPAKYIGYAGHAEFICITKIVPSIQLTEEDEEYLWDLIAEAAQDQLAENLIEQYEYNYGDR